MSTDDRRKEFEERGGIWREDGFGIALATDSTAQLGESFQRVEEIKRLIRELDAKVSEFHDSLVVTELPTDANGYCKADPDIEKKLDAQDRLRQIHFKLTDCKGQIGAVNAVLHPQISIPDGTLPPPKDP